MAFNSANIFHFALRNRAIGPLAWLLVGLSLTASCATPRQAELDAEVRRLCAIDGGVHVYLTAVLPPSKFDQFGNPIIPSKASMAPDDAYYFERQTSYYREGNPQLSRSQHRIIRRSDGKLMGEAIRYARGGGDLPSPKHGSTFICPDPLAAPMLESSIFRKDGSK